ncbi:helix-turn-helix domain-containing protein [Larkinella sp. GY13]|uniref:helix-turn-helix transcriptional regulator n=1 Tax=Larkinella sp. GY13 TaxID=3453720 RepID=UPI003EE83688
MDTTIHERLSKLIKEFNMNTSSFAKAIEKSYNAIESIVKGKTRPSYDVLEAIFKKFPDINPTWLMNGEGEMLRGNQKESAKADGYLQEHLILLEQNFSKLLEQLKVKDQQIAGLQRTVDALVGKSEDVTVDRSLTIEHPATKIIRLGYAQPA